VCLEGKGQNFLINQYRRYSKCKYTHLNPELRTEGSKPDIAIVNIYTAQGSSVRREVS